MRGQAGDSIIGSPAFRVTLVMSSLFSAAGVTLVFLPRWLEIERALSGAEIGAILSLAQFARVLTGPAIALWTDSARDRRTPLLLLSGAAVVAYAVFFFFAHGFWSLLAVGFVALSITQALAPLVEAATLRATAQGKITYGVARGIGSIAFILGNVLGGILVARFGIEAIVAWVLVSLALLLISTLFALLPDPQMPREPGVTRFGAITTLLRSRRFLLIIASCGLIQSAHAFYYGFSTLVWRGQGLPADLVGMLWAFGVAVEVVFLWSLAPIERRVSPEALILVGAAGSAVRWVAMGFAPTGGVLWLLQATHVLSFAAAHVGAMRLIYREAPDNAAAMAQTLYAALSAGILMGASTLLSGWLYDLIGARGYWAMTLLAVSGGALALLLLAPGASRARSA